MRLRLLQPNTTYPDGAVEVMYARNRPGAYFTMMVPIMYWWMLQM